MKVINIIPSYKAATTFLIVALLSCMCLSYKLYDDSVQTKAALNNEKNAVMLDLRKSKDSLELAISENSSLKTELIIERQKVSNLLDEIGGSNIDMASLLKYKKEMMRLKEVVASLTKEKVELRKNNDLLKIQRDSTILVLSQSRKYNDTLLSMNEDLHRVIKKGSKVSVINLKTSALKQLRNGDYEETDKASKTNALQISFLVIGNKMDKACEKEYYIQIIDSKNNVIGKKLTKKFGPMILDYSYASSVKFKNETLEVTSDLELSNLEKGNYYVNVFDKGELASKGTFALR